MADDNSSESRSSIEYYSSKWKNSHGLIAWMTQKIYNEELVYLDDIAWDIKEHFGDEYLDFTESGDWKLSKKFQREFRDRTRGSIFWVPGERAWRVRNDDDPPPIGIGR